MKNFKTLTSIFLLTVTILGCSKSDPETEIPLVATVSCVTTNTLFQQLYNPLNTVAYPESLSLYNNAVTHEYTFNVTNAATICSIGYQSQTTLATLNYQMDIYDTVTSTVVATVTSIFSPTTTSYVSLSTPLVLVAGRSYKIKRHSPASPANPNGAGRCVYNVRTLQNSPMGNVSFPKTFGNLTITDSDFYTSTLFAFISANDNNNSLPFIDIVFQ